MSQRMAAEIWIGGKVAASLVPDLCGAIAHEGVSLEWGDAPFRPTTPEDLHKALRENDRGVPLLWLCDNQASWGQFDTLEAFLQEHGIPYTRRSEGAGQYDPELVEFRPRHEPVSLSTNTAGEPVVLASGLEPVDNLLAAALELEQRRSTVDCWSLVKTAYRILHEQQPLVWAPLEPFEIEQVEDEDEDEDKVKGE
jgi:hypothetical protein